MQKKYSDGNEGKCRYCGFLSKHARRPEGLPAPRFYEMEHSERIEGNFDNHAVVFQKMADTEPMCFLEIINFEKINQTQGRAKLLEEINADRQCESWYPYIPGLSPKDHYEEYQMQHLELERREFEARLHDMSLRAQEAGALIAEKNATVQQKNVEIAEASRQLVSELKDIAKHNDRFSKRMTWLVIGLALIQIIVGLMEVYDESYTDRLLETIFGPLGR